MMESHNLGIVPAEQLTFFQLRERYFKLKKNAQLWKFMQSERLGFLIRWRRHRQPQQRHPLHPHRARAANGSDADWWAGHVGIIKSAQKARQSLKRKTELRDGFGFLSQDWFFRFQFGRRR
jgi:hypothetical protein